MDHHHHQQPPQYNHPRHHQQPQKQQQKQYQRRKRSPPIKKEEDISAGLVKMEKRIKNENDHQDPLVTNLENVFFSDNNQDQQFNSLAQQQVHESSLMEVIKVLQDQINTVSNITRNQDNQFSSSSSEASPEARVVSEPLISYDNQESCPVKYSDSASTVMASTDLGGIEFSHVWRYRYDEDLFYQLFQYSKILSLNFAYFNDEDVLVDNDQKIGNINNQVSDNEISVSDYLVDRPVDVCVDNNGGGCVDGETDDEWIERVLNEVALASESHQVVTEVQ